jgi:hypothetical protein
VIVAAMAGIGAWQPALALIIGGTGNEITGLVLSLTVILKVHIRLVFPDKSVAVYVTGVVPTGNIEPGKWDLVHVRLPAAVQLSVAVGSTQTTTAEHKPGSLFTVKLARQPEITGGTKSLIKTLKDGVVNVQPDAVFVSVTFTVPAPAEPQLTEMLFPVVDPLIIPPATTQL